MKKIKGSAEAVKMKYLLFVFAAAVLVTLPIRVYQLIAVVDAQTGFYTSSDITVSVLGAALAVFVLLFLVLGYISKEVPSPKLPVGKNPVLGVTSALMTVALLWDIVSVERAVFPTRQNSVEIFFAILRSNLAGKEGVSSVLQMLFALFGVIYFAVFAISHLNGKASYKEFKLLALSPLCWSITRLVAHLMKEISFLTVSELLLEIFMLVFFMLFFITFARISSGVFSVDSMWGIYGYGLCAAMFAALVTIPRLVILAVGLEPVSGNEFNFADIACLIFILSYIFASLGVGFKDGLKNRKTVTEVELPDENAVVSKKNDASASGYFDNSEAIESEEPAVEDDDNSDVLEKVEEIVRSVEDETAGEADGFVEEVESEEDAVYEEVFEDIPEEDIFTDVTEEIAEQEDEPEIYEEVPEFVEEVFETDTDFENAGEEFTKDIQTEEAEDVFEDAVTDVEEAADEAEEAFEDTAEEVSADESEDDGEDKTHSSWKDKIFGKKEDESEDEEEITPVSLADLKKRNKN